MRFLGRFAVICTFALASALPACEEDSGCKDDYDCEGAFVCKVSKGTCEAFVCADAGDCDEGETCVDNACVSDASQ